MIPQDREVALSETTSRVLEWARDLARQPGKLSVEEIINETLYFERRRRKGSVRALGKAEDQAYWRETGRRFLHASQSEQIDILRAIIHRYADEIIGHFNPLVYGALTRYGAKTLSLVLHSMSPLKIAQAITNFDSLDDNVHVIGEVQQLKTLSKLGTVILAPTHVSHLDAVVLGASLAKLGLPPFLYGAGYNLFRNPFFGPFLKRLGAYTVDWQKKAPIYNQVLKTFATVSMEMGYHHILFPGGARARSGQIERKLKNGLLGCGIEAYEGNVRRKKPRPKVFVVPCTLSYQMVLEAETLIADYLAEAGKARYITEDDESSQASRMLLFMRSVLKHQSSIHMHIGRALDTFGNRVNAEGESSDETGRIIDITGYLKTAGKFAHDAQRNEEFTRELARSLCQEYPKGNVAGPTHAVAWVLFDMLLAEARGADLYRVLREGQAHTGFIVDAVRGELAPLLDKLKVLAAEQRLLLDPVLSAADIDEVLSRALVHFGVYHAEPAVERRGNRVFVLNRALLYYYRNRLFGAFHG